MTDTPATEPTTTDTTTDAAEAVASTWTPPASQEDLDRIITARLQKERAKYADYDDLRAAADRLAELEKEQLSEVERAKQDAADAAARADAAEQALRDARRSAVIASAAKDAHDPAEVARLLDVADDADDQTITAAVADLLAAKPYLVRTPGKPIPTPGAGAPPTGDGGFLTLEEIGSLDPVKVAKDAELYKLVVASRNYWAKQTA